MSITPYVVGQWVRDERFYGRGALLQEILEGNRNCLWVLGTRRIGKTSILKQLEHLASSSPSARYFPLFWDFQGSEGEEDLHEGFRDALLDANARLEALHIPLVDVEDEDLFTSMSHLLRELRSRDLSLLLLGDEVEELINIQEKAPRFLRRLRRALQSTENIRAVLASTIRLWGLASEKTTTSPFLHGFTPPLPIRGLSDDDARSLVRQSQLPPAFRPHLDEQKIEVIRARCNNHPYLLQLLSERCIELGDLDRAIEEIASDEMVSFFFGTDLAMLTKTERSILESIDEQDLATGSSIRTRLALDLQSLQAGLQRLELLGFIHSSSADGYSLANYFFKRWFGELSKVGRGQLSDAGQVSAIQTTRLAVAEGPCLRIDDRYELLARLGHGATGEVYKAHDALLRTVVAIKILREEYSADEEAVERLRREVVLARDVTHPHLLKIYHLGDDQGRKYITMQFVDGPDLARVIAAEAPLAAPAAVVIARKLAGALAALHRCQVLHRDIKPSNILIDQAWEPRISDFGLARLKWAPGITSQGTFLGTPAYASPEQLLGERPDERSDLYSLGVVFYEMITGRLPFDAESVGELVRSKLETVPPAPRELRAGIPTVLSDLILRCFAREPSLRFENATQLNEALAGLARHWAQDGFPPSDASLTAR